MLPRYDRVLGCFVEGEEQKLRLLLCQASYEKMKYLPHSKLTIYKTYNLGYAYSSCLGKSSLLEMMALGKVSDSISVKLRYCQGNIVAYIRLKDIDLRSLLTDELYAFVHDDDLAIWKLYIGKPSNANNLYHRRDLDGVTGTLAKLAGIEGLNTIYVVDTSLDRLP
jgi:hypothetical protein